MPLKKPAALVPLPYAAELHKLSKTAIMDLLWSMTGRVVECAEDSDAVMRCIRNEWELVRGYRE